jgi:hypothetical protein
MLNGISPLFPGPAIPGSGSPPRMRFGHRGALRTARPVAEPPPRWSTTLVVAVAMLSFALGTAFVGCQRGADDAAPSAQEREEA